MYAVIRAAAVSAAAAIAFGLHLHYAFWMPLSTVVAMKPSLQQGTLAVEQRLAGTILGAAVAALLLLTVHDKHALDVVIVVLGGLAGSIFTVNFALFTAALTALILTALDLPDPTNSATEGKRVLFTFAGVGIAAIVMLLADRLQKRQTPAAPTAHRTQPPATEPSTHQKVAHAPPTAPRTGDLPGKRRKGTGLPRRIQGITPMLMMYTVAASSSTSYRTRISPECNRYTPAAPHATACFG